MISLLREKKILLQRLKKKKESSLGLGVVEFVSLSNATKPLIGKADYLSIEKL